jgi:hypothetical protein
VRLRPEKSDHKIRLVVSATARYLSAKSGFSGLEEQAEEGWWLVMDEYRR